MFSWDWPDANDRTLLRFIDTLPLLLLCYAHAILVVIPAPRLVRAALLPFTLYYAWYGGTHYDFARTLAWPLGKIGYEPERLNYLNFMFAIICIGLACRSMEWTITPGPYRRYDRPIGDAPPVEHPLTPRYVLSDAFELCMNLRGIGWSFTRNKLPTPVSPPLHKLILLLDYHWITVDFGLYACQRLQPSMNLPSGASIFDPARPPLERVLVGCTHTAISGLIIFRGIQVMCEVGALISRLFMGLEDWQWPRLFDSPWRATSIADFWARWHQLFRRFFVVIGARPVGRVGRFIAGKTGERVLGVMGAFGISALLHALGTWAMGHGYEFWPMGGFFVMQGVGAVLEGASPVKPKGVAGWVWTMAWTVGWGTQMVDAWARRGLFASDFVPGWARPSVWVVERLPAYVVELWRM
ncbi:unnamed protein product [Peniophora sp. CBMAI 1063]|nr:unnamed protein product [Peniophora sp. CBMAI 1063]